MRHIHIDPAAGTKAKAKHWNACVGGGRAYESLTAENQRHLKEAVEECGFRYLRFHGLLHDDMGVYTEDSNGHARYNFQYIDLLFDFMLQIGVRPFLELGFMPKALASGKTTIFAWNGNVTMPKSMEKWSALIAALFRHLIARYGKAEVRRWPVEVWNEPNLRCFFDSDQPFEDYLKLYANTVKAVKSVDDKILVGGPATAGLAWVEPFISACAANEYPLDFISTHNYGCVDYQSGDDGYVDLFGTGKTVMHADSGTLIKGAQTVHHTVRSSALPALQIHYTEWSASYTPRDPVHDSYYSAAYILDQLTGFDGLADSMSYWTFSDIFEETGPGPSPFHGGFGLQNIQGIKKPSFFAFQYLNMLPEQMIPTSDQRCVAGTDGQTFAVLFWDHTPPVQTKCNQLFFKENPEPAAADPVELTVCLPDGQYRLEQYAVGYGVNDCYTAFLHMNTDGTLLPKQVEFLKSKCSGEAIASQMVSVRGGYTAVQPMRQNDVYLYVFYPVDK